MSHRRGVAAIGLWRFRRAWLAGEDEDEDLGRRGEELAARELARRGYEIVERRWRSRLGEIDLVARDGDTLVVVEVKTRSRDDCARPEDAVDRRKRRKLVQLARCYLRARHLRDVNVRFDVVGITARAGRTPEIEVVRDAFEAPE